MAQLFRRALLAGGGLSVAAGLLGRKPARAQTVLTPVAEPEVRLRGLEGLVVKDAPTPLAEQGFADAEGRPVSLADFRGKGVVLNMWATWCVPCVAEMPALAAAAAAWAADGIVVLALSSDRGGAPVVQRFYAAHGIAGLGVFLDSKGMAARAWGARGLPTTVIVGRDGLERGRVEGAVDWASAAVVERVRGMV